jgi:hypothetical protein
MKSFILRTPEVNTLSETGIVTVKVEQINGAWSWIVSYKRVGR